MTATKKKTTRKKTRKTRRESISTVDFLNVYRPMVQDGKNAQEIGEALGRDATFVCVKAAQLRGKFKKDHEAGKITNEQYSAVLARIPKIQGSGSTLLNAVLGDENVQQCDSGESENAEQVDPQREGSEGSGGDSQA
jgi:hypothetical protein